MADALLWHRIQFAFTVTFHYLFPQLTMGLVVLIVAWKSLAVVRGDERYNEAARSGRGSSDSISRWGS